MGSKLIIKPCIWPNCRKAFETTTNNTLGLCPKHLKIHKRLYYVDWRNAAKLGVAKADRAAAVRKIRRLKNHDKPTPELVACVEGGIGYACPICPARDKCAWASRVLVSRKKTTAEAMCFGERIVV